MKKCWTCKQTKSLDEFGNKKSSKDGKQGYCKLCSKQKDKKHYTNSSTRKSKIRENSNYRIDRARKYILDYLLVNHCVDCGESDIVVLEFDHIASKERNISLMISRGMTEIQLQNEISKCEVRCANCHKRKTAKQFGWWKLLDKHKG
jgi:hypothetical protein